MHSSGEIGAGEFVIKSLVTFFNGSAASDGGSTASSSALSWARKAAKERDMLRSGGDGRSPLGDFDQWRDGVEGIGHPREERVLVIPGKGRERVELGGRV